MMLDNNRAQFAWESHTNDTAIAVEWLANDISYPKNLSRLLLVKNSIIIPMARRENRTQSQKHERRTHASNAFTRFFLVEFHERNKHPTKLEQ